MNYSIGQIVFSKQGHDKDVCYLVVRIDGEYLFLVDGKIRLLDNPKKKKKKHVQLVSYVDNDIKQKVEECLKVTNADFRAAIEKYKNKDAKGE